MKTSFYFEKMKKKMENVIGTMNICCQDIGMEFGIEQCSILIMKNGERETIEGIELLN